MSSAFNGPVRDASILTFSFLAWHFGVLSAEANPTGQSVAQGSATFNTAGSQFTVTAANNTVINWSTFNIAAGETTTFVQPSSTSVVWNNINDSNPSQILGNLYANGYVVLQNQNGFVVGGAATISTHGLLMTTSPTPPPNLAGGGPWQFDALPPTASIINYGQITSVGGPAFLIANDIINANDPVKGTGTITAEQGNIGLYAGQEVLVSTSPDGRGISARVTLPSSAMSNDHKLIVDNEGRLIADGGAIMARAETVNQNGLMQANTVVNNNGVIELVASGDLTVGPQSRIEAGGDSTTGNPSNGGFVVLQAGNNYSDTSSSVINVAKANGGLNGVVEVFGGNLTDATSLQSHIGGTTALLVNPYDLTISSLGFDPNTGQSILTDFSQVNLHALDNIEVDTPLFFPDATASASLSLEAGNSIILDPGTGISGGANWNVNLTAGTAFVPGVSQPTPPSGSDGVYLNGGSVVQTVNGDINIFAANEVVIQGSYVDPNTFQYLPSGAIITTGGGNIAVSAQYGDVNAGNNPVGYTFGLNPNTSTGPYYAVNAYGLGGISTAAGGNVNISAGGDVFSYLPTQADYNNGISAYDGGTGAFGPEAGNVTITAGGSVYGNYVVANGAGQINAGQNAGAAVNSANLSADFALSLVKGSWSVNAQNIYLDDVINPNGVFNDASGRHGKPNQGYHYFDYDPNASVSLTAAHAVEITGAEVPLFPASDVTGLQIPILLPPTLTVVTGTSPLDPGVTAAEADVLNGFTLDANVILFPSADGNLSIETLNGGGFSSRQNPNAPNDVNVYTLEMSDSAQHQWSPLVGTGIANEIFGYSDHAPTPPELANATPVQISISGDMNDVNLYTTKETDLNVDGNAFNAGLVGENLHPTDVTAVTVKGSISYSPIYTLITLSSPLSAGWDSVFSQIVNSTGSSLLGQATFSVSDPIPAGDVGNNSALKKDAASALVFGSSSPNPGFVYDPATQQLGYSFQMSSLVETVLENPMKGIVFNSKGVPEIQLGQASLGQDPTQYYFVTTTLNFLPASDSSAIATLYNNSQPSVKDAQHLSPGFQIGGPGAFDVTAASIDLGASQGIVSWGAGDGASTSGGINYASLAALTGAAGASVDVTTTSGDLDMLTSTIASIDGGAVDVTSAGAINLGIQSLSFAPVNSGNLAYGIWTSAAGDVNVTAQGDINIDTARIATFNGGNVSVTSNDGSVNAGDGANQDLNVPVYLFDPKTGSGMTVSIDSPRPYGSGILALSPSPTSGWQVNPGPAKGPGEFPGNITVNAPKGNIVSTLGGIAQFGLDNSVGAGPTVTLNAGTVGVPASTTQGNINLGQGGVIGGTVVLNAQGNIKGLIVSRQDTTVKAVGNVGVTVLSGGNANIAAGGTLSGVIVGMGAVNASGGAGITATMLSSSVSANGGAAASTLGAATASASATSAAATSSTDARQQVASNLPDDDQKKKKPLTLMQRLKRVTVILPKT
jgi:filamentous hemagglutinin family protein